MNIIHFDPTEAVIFGGPDEAVFISEIKRILRILNVNNFGEQKNWICNEFFEYENNMEYWKGCQSEKVKKSLVKQKILKERKNEDGKSISFTEFYLSGDWYSEEIYNKKRKNGKKDANN